MEKEVRLFLQQMSEKHKVEIGTVMVGYVGTDLYVWSYNEGAYEVFKTLEIIPA